MEESVNVQNTGLAEAFYNHVYGHESVALARPFSSGMA